MYCTLNKIIDEINGAYLNETCMSQWNNNYKLPGVNLYVEIDMIKSIDCDYKDEDRNNTIEILINLQWYS